MMIGRNLIEAWCRGQGLEVSAVDSLIEGVDRRPDDLECRGTLLGALWDVFIESAKGGPLPWTLPPRFRVRTLDEIVWWAENDPLRLDVPLIPVGALERIDGAARARVVAGLEPASGRSLGAARVLAGVVRARDASRAAELIQRAREAFPGATEAAVEISDALAGRQKLDRAARSVSLLSWFQVALANAGNIGLRRLILEQACKAAIGLDQDQRASDWATELLDSARSSPRNWNTGNALYVGHTTLGVVALREDDESRACLELISAGECGGSPQLNSFGPDLRFANQLLRAGHRLVVLEFLELVAQFWRVDQGQLARWVEAIERGETPTLDVMED